MLTADQVIALIERRTMLDGLVVTADAAGVDKGQLSRIVTGRQRLSAGIAGKLGYRQVVMYERTK